MKKILALFLFLIVLSLLQSCVDKIVVADIGKPTGKIFLDSDPPGAEIYLLGTKTDKVTPDSIDQLNKGEYDITLKKADYRDTSFKITVYDSLTTSKKIVLQSIFETGDIFLQSEPVGAEIFLDSVKTNSLTPDTLKNVIAGEHKITLKKENYKDTTIIVSVQVNETISKTVVLNSLVKTGNIYLSTNPAGAQIFLDSVSTSKVTPDTLKNIVTGYHIITLKKIGYIDTSIIVSVKENTTASRTIDLRLAVTKGNVHIESSPAGAQIFLDDLNTNKLTPDTLKNIAAGLHKITLKENNYKDTTIEVTVVNNVTISKSVTLTPKVKKGNIYISSNPGGAQVFLDSVSTGKITPDTLKNILAGTHKITLKKNNYIDTTLIVTVQENQTVSKSVALTPIIIRGNIYIESEPDSAQILIDGKNTSKVTPDTLLNYPVGTHSITLQKKDYRDTTFQINIIGYLTISKKVTLTSINGNIFIQSNPPGAGIYLSDKTTGKTTPDTLKNLAAGTYRITLKLTEYNDTSFYTIVKQNTTTSENIILTKTVEYGDLYIQSDPSGAAIYIDNNNTGQSTPDTIKSLIVGSHKVTLKLNGYFDASANVNIEKGSVANKSITLTEVLPVQTDTLYYSYIFISGQTKFTFSFNQDITLDKVDIIEPGSTSKNSFDFSGEAISKDAAKNIYYPKYLIGEWQLIFYGKKVSTGKSFTLNKTLTVP
ncbi:MAG: PEGA domain-containing protein [Ignavibacteriaceae bacterium]